MHPENEIVGIIRDRQKAMRREIDRRGIALKAVAMDSKVSYSTLLTYLPADQYATPVQMPASVIFALTGILPGDILSLLLPSGHLIVEAPEMLDHDEVSEALCDYLRTKEAAHRIDSECGPAIGPNEDMTLRGKFAVVTGGRAA